jgi:hypothetical protein
MEARFAWSCVMQFLCLFPCVSSISLWLVCQKAPEPYHLRSQRRISFLESWSVGWNQCTELLAQRSMTLFQGEFFSKGAGGLATGTFNLFQNLLFVLQELIVVLVCHFCDDFRTNALLCVLVWAAFHSRVLLISSCLRCVRDYLCWDGLSVRFT